MANTRFIIHGTHISENLQHHKVSDVRRILEEKGFKEVQSDGAADIVHFHPGTGTPESQKQTNISFGEAGFVEENGVTHSG